MGLNTWGGNKVVTTTAEPWPWKQSEASQTKELPHCLYTSTLTFTLVVNTTMYMYVLECKNVLNETISPQYLQNMLSNPIHKIYRHKRSIQHAMKSHSYSDSDVTLILSYSQSVETNTSSLCVPQTAPWSPCVWWSQWRGWGPLSERGPPGHPRGAGGPTAPTPWSMPSPHGSDAAPIDCGTGGGEGDSE